VKIGSIYSMYLTATQYSRSILYTRFRGEILKWFVITYVLVEVLQDWEGFENVHECGMQ